MYIKEETDGTTRSFNLVAPSGATNKVNEVLFPFSEEVAEAYAASIELAIAQMNSFHTIATLTGNVTLTGAADAQLTKGAIVIVKVTADTSNRTITFSTGIAGANIIITASTTRYIVMIYDGTNFVVANQLQADYTDSETQAPVYAASIALSITAHETFVDVAELTGALTLTATAAAGLKKGAKLYVTLTSDTTARDTTLSTGFVAGTVAGVISKTKVATFVFNGTNFKLLTAYQIN